MTLEALTIDLPDNGDSAELAAYKQRVRAVAQQYAERHDWCRVLDGIFSDLNIPTAAPKCGGR